MNNQKFFRFITGCIRFWLGFILLSGGVTKMFHGHFIQLIGPPWLETELEKYNLSLYGIFIAYSQIIIGFMLLVKRFATLGAIMAVPMFANILMVTISLHWQGTPFVVAFFLLCNMYLLVWDFHKLKFLISDDVEPIKNIPIKRHDKQLDTLYIMGLVLLLIAVSVRSFDEKIPKILAYASLFFFVITYLWGVWKYKKQTPKS
jgi:hypothetical protein